MGKPVIKTFGCRLNFYESEIMRALAVKAGFGEGTVIVNSCAVTGEAERQVRQYIRRAKRDNPDSEIIVTGCSAQVDPVTYENMGQVSRVIGNNDKLKPESWGLPAGNDVQLIEGYEDRSRAFLQVQNGCDNRCTFCIIPFGRGKARSVPVVQIARQVKNLFKSGYNEIVFTGVDITSYGPDMTLGEMIAKVFELVPELPRLRLSSLDPAAIDEDLWQLIAQEKRLCPHLHLSVQAGDDMILKRMKRRHSYGDVIEVCERARSLRSDMVFGADIITGFPTESDEMFENTMRLVEEAGLTFLHVFPYSEREGTPAARIPNKVSVPVRKERAARLRALGEKQVERLLESSIGKDFDVIVEKNGVGRTQTFLPVRLKGDYDTGDIVSVKSTGVKNGMLIF